MKQITTDPGAVYCVYTATGCTVTDTATGCTLMTAEPGQPNYFAATGHSVTLSDADATCLRPRFKSAPAALSLLGGGANKLPAGYLQAAFLESTGEQFMVLPDLEYQTAEVDIVFRNVKEDAAAVWGLFGGNLKHVDRWGVGIFCNYRGEMLAIRLDNRISAPFEVNVRRTVRVSPVSLQIGSLSAPLEQKAGSNPFYSGLFAIYQRTGGVNYKANGLQVFSCSAKDRTTAMQLVPALAPDGVPVMYDRLRKTEVQNNGTGKFILGMTFGQASKLGMALPEGGGELTISLPDGWKENSRVHASLSLAAVRNWIIPVQPWPTAAAAATTFALRRVWVRRSAHESGYYVAADGSRWAVEWCEEVFGADPESLGYERYRSVDAAISYWELTPYIAPEAEQA